MRRIAWRPLPRLTPLLGECVVTPRAVDGDAEDLRAIFFELWQRLVVERHLIAADRAPVRRIKGDDHRLAGEIAEAQALVGCDVHVKSGALAPGGRIFARSFCAAVCGSMQTVVMTDAPCDEAPSPALQALDEDTA